MKSIFNLKICYKKTSFTAKYFTNIFNAAKLMFFLLFLLLLINSEIKTIYLVSTYEFFATAALIYFLF